MIVVSKLVAEDEIFPVDFSARSEIVAGEVIVSAVFRQTPSLPNQAPLVFGAQSLSGGVVSQRISGGARNVSYTVECDATTNGGNVIGVKFQVPVS